MKTRIESISDLQAERARLKNQIETSRVRIKTKFDGIKEDINPARQAVQTVTSLMSKPKENVFLSRGIDLALALTPLSRAVWPVRILLPIAIKRVTTNYLSSNHDQVLLKTLTWVKKATDHTPHAAKPKVSVKEKVFRWLKKVSEPTPTEELEEILQPLELGSPEYASRVPL